MAQSLDFAQSISLEPVRRPPQEQDAVRGIEETVPAVEHLDGNLGKLVLFGRSPCHELGSGAREHSQARGRAALYLAPRLLEFGARYDEAPG